MNEIIAIFLSRIESQAVELSKAKEQIAKEEENVSYWKGETEYYRTAKDNVSGDYQALRSEFNSYKANHPEQSQEYYQMSYALARANDRAKFLVQKFCPDMKEMAYQLVDANPTNKIACIKELRTMYGLGLKEAKDVIEDALAKAATDRLKERFVG